MSISVSYTTIPDSDIDPDSPITTGLFTSIRDNITWVREWIGKNYIAGAAEDHNHDGTNSAPTQSDSMIKLFAFTRFR